MEPSPFSHISGMKNRFESLIKTLREAGDEVMVVTPDPQPPKEFCGAQVCIASASDDGIIICIKSPPLQLAAAALLACRTTSSALACSLCSCPCIRAATADA